MTAAPEYRWQAVGRRKTSVARVYLTPGTGKWDINGRTLGDFFPRPSLVQHIQQSFTATDTLGAFDVRAHVNGGGQAGQAGALRLAIARALVEADSRGRAEKAGPPGSAEAIPVQQALGGRAVGRWLRVKRRNGVSTS
jgi:ribosomal protein S9